MVLKIETIQITTLKQLTDEEIKLEIASGKLELLSILFDRYNLRIYNFFNKMVSEDLTQDVFIKVIRYRTSYKNGKFAAWIFTIARNIFSTYYQKTKKERTNEIDNDKLDANETLAAESNQEAIDHLQKALLKLPNSDRELIVMHRYQVKPS